MENLELRSKSCKARDFRMAIVLLILTLSGCSVCKEDLIEKVKSPDGRYVAAVFERNCGATSSIQYHVNLRSNWGWFTSEAEGNIEEGEVFFTQLGTIKVKWQNDKTLLIECAKCNDSNYSKNCTSTWKDVSITCLVSRSAP